MINEKKKKLSLYYISDKCFSMNKNIKTSSVLKLGFVTTGNQALDSYLSNFPPRLLPVSHVVKDFLVKVFLTEMAVSWKLQHSHVKRPQSEVTVYISAPSAV